MKISKILFILIFITLIGCNEDNEYLEVIKHEKQFIINEIEQNSKKVEKFYNNNEVKYTILKNKSDYLIKLKDTILNNNKNINIVKYVTESINKLPEYSYLNTDFLNTNFDIDNEVEYNLFINKYLIVTNNMLYQMIFNSNIKDYRFSHVYTAVKFDKYFFKKGEIVEAKIYLGAEDTTAKYAVQMENGKYIDTIDEFGRFVYRAKFLKKGITKIKGNYIIKHDFYNKEYLFPFEAEIIIE